ncbi:MAG: SWIM zinc finger family protein [Xenococcaceae cyanobacterium MO_234.B1]|nr:SWIM zinc finger family protein [Xenococcaceae cyanobacterium MO_234.B1]
MTNFQVETREWWVERWLELLDSYRFKKRLERGRNYAREGNVLSIDFRESKAFAKVQGSDVEPYQVSLALEPFTDEDWDYVIATMSQKAIYSAQLLAGEMPDNIEQVFTANGLSLFPFSLSDVRSRCSCPDKANPCKHIAAVYYQLGDRFSEDPFVIFQLRGRTREQILEMLRQLRSQRVAVKGEAIKLEPKKTEINTKPTQKQDKNAIKRNFWQYDEPLESSLINLTPPTDNKTVLDLLGKIPLPTADADAVQQFLVAVYLSSRIHPIGIADGTGRINTWGNPK